MNIKWILERDMFHDKHERLATAIEKNGQEVISWNDDWWETSNLDSYNDEKVIFHGCLENAARICSETKWKPGAYCDVEAFNCSSWYSNAKKWLVNSEWVLTTVNDLVENPQEILQQIGVKDQFFVRPNSPLKPFSGRLIETKNLSLNALDHGFYYDDTSLQIIVSPCKNIGKEWRYIVAGNKVITGSGYIAETRTEVAVDPKGDQWQFASKIAQEIDPPDDVYVMDVCLVDDELKLLELNPFSGADLYGCDRDIIVKSISEIL